MQTDTNPVRQWDSIADDNATPVEAARWIRRSPETLKRWRRMRVGPPFFTVQGRVFYSKRQLQAWIEQQRDNSQAGA
ncbi:helix-turn-helix domain-containing protein [Pseudoxanthomonas koreensis]|uniref:helix-turn-helix domain-containing protein n=1 Tax=Pseudoxanthomonas koreensis TaxID=266061 RepID=UPI001390BDB3|nr:helix-turn-helix domain-containing protein [Pseudoxanthomonas koreensis]KAF1691849.1 MerR family transcriptional regulator [Pseudoxanthomonas koreensis]